MKALNTTVVQESRASPSLNAIPLKINEVRIGKKINAIGMGGIWWLEFKWHNGRKISHLNRTGLLISVTTTKKTRKTTYTIATGDKQGIHQVIIGPNDEVNPIHLHDLIEFDREFQYIPVNKGGKLTFEIEKITRLEKIDQEEWEGLISREIDRLQ